MENGKTNKTTIYKDVFNKHRRKPDNPLYIDDINEMVDFSSANPLQHQNIIDLSEHRRRSQSSNNSDSFQYEGPIYGLKSHPGFAYIPSALSTTLQRDLVYKAVTEFCEPPHGTNIDLVPLKVGIEVENLTPEESMWELWKSQNIDSNGDINSLVAGNNEESTQFSKDERINTKDNGTGTCMCTSTSKQKNRSSDNTKKDTKNPQNPKKKYYKTFEKLSWATLGYRFDWTARAYREKNKSAMPKVLDELGNFFARLGEETKTKLNVNVDSTTPTTSIDNYTFTASAAIVNYYSLKSSMGGHRDDSELDVTKPVVSFSLGLPAVFMIGGKTREEGPVVPLLLRPGDVMLLGGDSRLNFHGIARILSQEVSVKLPKVGSHIGSKRIDDFQIRAWSSIFGDEYRDRIVETPPSDRLAIDTFLLQHRVNANVRQVLPDGVDRIPGDDG